jgi:hypothetical protein
MGKGGETETRVMDVSASPTNPKTLCTHSLSREARPFKAWRSSTISQTSVPAYESDRRFVQRT